MGRHKTVHGRCRLCGEKKVLSFEHIPPRSSYNKNTIYSISSLQEFLESEDVLNPKKKGILKQGGTGNNSLCIECNNFLGRTYVDSYNGWVNVGLKVLKNYSDTPITFLIGDFEPLKVLKQIFSMFISMDDEDCYDRHTDLCEYIRDPYSNNLSKKYHILLFLNNVGNTFYIPPVFHGNLKTGYSVFCSELIFPPFGYVLTINNNHSIEKLIDITSFNNYKFDDKVPILFENLYKLPKHLPIPLDYREKSEIEKKYK